MKCPDCKKYSVEYYTEESVICRSCNVIYNRNFLEQSQSSERRLDLTSNKNENEFKRGMCAAMKMTQQWCNICKTVDELKMMINSSLLALKHKGEE